MAAAAVFLSSACGVGAYQPPEGPPPTLPAARTTQPTRATGCIAGTVDISTALFVRRPQFRTHSDPGAASLPPAPPKDQIAAELRNVVVYLKGDSAKLAGAGADNSAQQHGSIAGCDQRFTPHVIPVLVGGTVDFPHLLVRSGAARPAILVDFSNDDDLYHNVFSLRAAGIWRVRPRPVLSHCRLPAIWRRDGELRRDV